MSRLATSNLGSDPVTGLVAVVVLELGLGPLRGPLKGRRRDGYGTGRQLTCYKHLGYASLPLQIENVLRKKIGSGLNA